MLLSHFGDFDSNSTANQFAVQSQSSLSAVSVCSLSAVLTQSPQSLRGVTVES